jgi:hypothetical protein
MVVPLRRPITAIHRWDCLREAHVCVRQASAIAKFLDDRRRQTSNPSTKVALDVDMNIITFQERKALGAALIVERASQRREPPPGRTPVRRRKKSERRKQKESERPAFLGRDRAVLDDRIEQTGVTSRPRKAAGNTMTMAQYRNYMGELRRAGNGE